MKNILILMLISIVFIFSGCSDSVVVTNSSTPPPAQVSLNDAFGSTDNSGDELSRSLIVVISDLHLGDQRSIDKGYGWCIKNRDLLANFINQLASRPALKELVLAGDTFDEWVVPMEDDTFNGFGSGQDGESKFVDSIAAANPNVINAINNLIKSGVTATYVPGNHDMLVSEADMNRLFPGIKQRRDTPGMGAYSPDWIPEVVIEHSHRYDFYNSPDILSNKIPYSPQNYTNNPNAILPPGFFVSKIAASNGYSTTMPSLENNTNQQDQIFLYWASWQIILKHLKVSQDPDSKIIKTGIDGYTDNYAINDLAPSFSKEPLLYQKIEDNWNERQAKNQVHVPINVFNALTNEWHVLCDNQSYTQYFNYDSSKRIVVFGHTHHATLFSRTNKNKQKCIYANSGTWVDSGDPGCTCVVIEANSPTNTSRGSNDKNVSVYQFTKEQTLLKLYYSTITN